MKRLPFEPHGDMLELRNELRHVLDSLHAEGGQGLRALHTGSGSDRVDAENVLFYNVGTSAFSKLARTRVTFEKDGKLVDSSATHKFVSRYEITDDIGLVLYHLDSKIAEFEAQGSIPLLDPTAVWLAVKRGEQMTYKWSRDAPYALLARVGTPRISNLTVAIKSIFDGVIAGFTSHAHDASLQEIASRISARTGAEIDEITRYLTDEKNSFLNTGRLAWPRGKGIQWNPPDDRCVVGRLSRDASLGGGFAGEIWSVRPRNN